MPNDHERLCTYENFLSSDHTIVSHFFSAHSRNKALNVCLQLFQHSNEDLRSLGNRSLRPPSYRCSRRLSSLAKQQERTRKKIMVRLLTCSKTDSETSSQTDSRQGSSSDYGQGTAGSESRPRKGHRDTPQEKKHEIFQRTQRTRSCVSAYGILAGTNSRLLAKTDSRRGNSGSRTDSQTDFYANDSRCDSQTNSQTNSKTSQYIAE